MKKLGKLLCIFSVLATSSLSAEKLTWKDYKNTTLRIQKGIPGWCSKEKSEKLMDLIHEVKPEVCVEIGVFGGSSVYPMARTLKYFDYGTLYAIDPWETIDCLDGYDEEDPNYTWWNEMDLEKVYKDFARMLLRYNLDTHCNVLKMTAENAITHFEDESIDILHIDGNHTEENNMKDLMLYFPKLKKGGYLWFDDVGWTDVHGNCCTDKAIDFLSENCIFIEERSVIDKNGSCYLFRKPE